MNFLFSFFKTSESKIKMKEREVQSSQTIKCECERPNSDVDTTPSAKQTTLHQGPKILKRTIWWKMEPSQRKIPEPKPFRPIESISAKIDNKTPRLTEMTRNKTFFQNERLSWTANPVVNSLANINFKPGGNLFTLLI